MKKAFSWGRIASFFALFARWAAPAGAKTNAPTRGLSGEEALELAVEAYLFGYPLVTMEMTRRIMTNVRAPAGMQAPMGQFAHLRKYPDPAIKTVTAPNADTLYSLAWLDLSDGPYIFHVPEEHGRYYLMPMLDGWTNVIAAPGTRTTGTTERYFAIVGPRWKGPLPEGVTPIQSSTQMAWILGRTYCAGTREAYAAVHAIQDEYTLTPLRAWGGSYTPPEGRVDPGIDRKTPTRDQVDRLDAQTFFAMLAALMEDNIPAAQDAPMLAKMAKIGIIPGEKFDITRLDPVAARALKSAPKRALDKILTHENDVGEMIHGWNVALNLGRYGTNYLLRAVVTAIGLGANLPQDAVYPTAEVDAEGQRLNGAHSYVLHFPEGQAPPVNGFWSLTMYDVEYFFVPNELERYTLSPRDPLKYNADGSLSLYIQRESPGAEKVPNWLPAPGGDFILMLRLYWPKESVLTGAWRPPAVQRIGEHRSA